MSSKSVNRNSSFKSLFAAVVLTVMTASNKAALGAPKVVTSIAPIHSITTSIMDGIGEPELLMPATASPHDFALKPSQAGMLSNADFIIWVGHGLESFLVKPLETIGGNATQLELLDVPGMTLLPNRTSENFAEDHADEPGGHDHDDHGAVDPHIWLSLTNAKIIAESIAGTLAQNDPDNKDRYDANYQAFLQNVAQLETETTATLSPFKAKPFLVFHDGYQYFEKEFGLEAKGTLTTNSELKPGAKRVSEITSQLQSGAITCVFSEPQFDAKPVELITADKPIKVGILDPLGSKIDQGPDLYFDLIRTMAASFTTCLKD